MQVRLLRVSWLLSQARRTTSPFVLDRQQDLPEEALLKPAEAVRYLKMGRVAALSYRWIFSFHPECVQLLMTSDEH